MIRQTSKVFSSKALPIRQNVNFTFCLIRQNETFPFLLPNIKLFIKIANLKFLLIFFLKKFRYFRFDVYFIFFLNDSLSFTEKLAEDVLRTNAGLSFSSLNL